LEWGDGNAISEKEEISPMAYFCYIVRCKDGSYYTGWTLDPERRTRQHNSGRGAAYTRLHRPVELVYVEPQPDRSTAMRRERRIKSMTHAQKDGLAAAYHVEKEIND
jgi:putative endonuclease